MLNEQALKMLGPSFEEVETASSGDANAKSLVSATLTTTITSKI